MEDATQAGVDFLLAPQRLNRRGLILAQVDAKWNLVDWLCIEGEALRDVNIRVLVEGAAQLACLCIQGVSVGAANQLEARIIGVCVRRWRSDPAADQDER